MRGVGGAHARYYADYSSEIVILRVTTDPAPRMLYCFDQKEGTGEVTIQRLTRKLGADISAEELIVGTSLDIPELQVLAHDGGVVIGEGSWKGATLTDGVKGAVSKCLERYAALQPEKRGDR